MLLGYTARRHYLRVDFSSPDQLGDEMLRHADEAENCELAVLVGTITEGEKAE
jgi:hypothetical protein